MDCTRCGQPNDNGDSNVCRGCLASRNFPLSPVDERRSRRAPLPDLTEEQLTLLARLYSGDGLAPTCGLPERAVSEIRRKRRALETIALIAKAVQS